MERTIRTPLAVLAAMALLPAAAQTRYVDEVFTNAQITVTSDVTYGTNVDFMESDFSTTPPTVVPIALKFDVYQPAQGVDPVTARPVIVYAHTGNFLPPPLNGSPNGSKTDSCAVEICKRFARRGYVAVSVAYRHGWNPLGSTVQIRRGTLLNAVYRSIHDMKQSVRYLRANANGANDYRIDPSKVVIVGEGSGGYVAQAYVTLDRPAEMFIEKFRPDPFNANVSYIDTNVVGNIHGFGGAANMYTDNGFSSDVQMAVNLGGSLADTSWLNGGEVPLLSFHTVFDPFAPFGHGTVIVPTTGEQVVPVSGSNIAQQLWNDEGNNAPIVGFNNQDPYTARARSLYGTTVGGVAISPSPEGLFPFVRPRWPAPAMDEASPWQWWSPTSPLAGVEVAPGITAHMASLASNPDMSATKARAYIDTIMGYAAPRIACVLGYGDCVWASVAEGNTADAELSVYPNPANAQVTITSRNTRIKHVELRDVEGRLVRTLQVNTDRVVIDRGALHSGVYLLTLHTELGRSTRKVVFE